VRPLISGVTAAVALTGRRRRVFPSGFSCGLLF
jgi:hypothetical protein